MLTHLRNIQGLSERDLAQRTGLARETIRSCEHDPQRAKFANLEAIARVFEHRVLLAIVPDRVIESELSTVAISYEVCRDGFDSWKIHFMNFVDAFRRHPDVRLVLLPPITQLDARLAALLASIVATLCDESRLDIPDWARREYFLERPWFVSAMESLKASALLESPSAFRRNNIFVQENFLSRA